jgi:proline iminopeptidase
VDVQHVTPAGGSQDTVLEVRRHGTDGETVLLLHGGPGCPDYLGELAQALGTAGFRTFSYDQRGVGRSRSRGPYRVQDHVSDVEAVRRHTGSASVHIVGHSWGGLLGQLYLRRYAENVKSLTLANPSSGVGHDWIVMEREVMAYNREASGEVGFLAMGLLSGLSRLPGSAGDAAGRRLLARVWRNYFADPKLAPPPDATWLSGVGIKMAIETVADIKQMPATSLTHQALHPDVPVLILYGDNDIYGTSTAKTYRRFPTARAVTIPHCGHLPWLQSPRMFLALVTAFLRNPTDTTKAACMPVGRLGHARPTEKAGT